MSWKICQRFTDRFCFKATFRFSKHTFLLSRLEWWRMPRSDSKFPTDWQMAESIKYLPFCLSFLSFFLSSLMHRCHLFNFLLPCSEYSHQFRKAVYFRDINGWDKLALLRRLVSRGYWTSSKKKFCLSPHIRIWGDFEVQVFFSHILDTINISS